MTRPNFFIVGAPKCGTTAMYEYLKAHPEIYMPQEAKEPHYFAQEYQTPRMMRYSSEEAYLSLFDDATTELCLGEGSVLYLYSEEAAWKIHEFNPDAKIITMLRNPIDMMYSLFYQERYSGNEVLKTFEEALDLEEARKKGLHIPPRSNQKKLYYREIAKYSVQLERYYACFNETQIHIIIFDDFIADTARCYQQTLSFLGVDPGFSTNFIPVNVNKLPRFAMINRLTLQPPEWYRVMRNQLRRITSPALREIFNRKLRAINTKVEPRPKLSIETRRALAIEFKDEIDTLSSLLDIDLTHWYKEALG